VPGEAFNQIYLCGFFDCFVYPAHAKAPIDEELPLEMIFELHLLETLDLLFERKKKLPFE
jgi:hypothetical protein